MLFQPLPLQQEAARLDWYESESDFNHSRTNASKHKTIWIEEILEIVDPTIEGSRCVFQLRTKNTTYKLSTRNDKKAANEWVSLIRKAVKLQKNVNVRLSSGSGSSMQSLDASDNGCVYDENTEYQSVEECK